MSWGQVAARTRGWAMPNIAPGPPQHSASSEINNILISGCSVLVTCSHGVFAGANNLHSHGTALAPLQVGPAVFCNPAWLDGRHDAQRCMYTTAHQDAEGCVQLDGGVLWSLCSPMQQTEFQNLLRVACRHRVILTRRSVTRVHVPCHDVRCLTNCSARAMHTEYVNSRCLADPFSC